MKIFFPIFFVFAFCFLACKTDQTQDVKKAVETYQKTPSKANYELYMTAVKMFVSQNAESHKQCFDILVNAATNAFKYRDSQVALQFAGDAISKHGQGQNLAEPAAILALIARDVKYKELSTMRFEQPDFDRLDLLLKNNVNWLDSALISMKKRFVIDSTQKIDRELAMRYAYVADGAASVRNDPEKSPILMLKAAEAAIAADNAVKAITIFDRLLADWPNSPKASQAAFMRAFTLENNLNDLPNAKIAYQDFIKKYPKDDFADDAQMALKNLGKSPEELVKEFEKKNK
jgi:outer membrane protein assembly factor BamD (BamD/ComL family)